MQTSERHFDPACRSKSVFQVDLDNRQKYDGTFLDDRDKNNTTKRNTADWRNSLVPPLD